MCVCVNGRERETTRESVCSCTKVRVYTDYQNTNFTSKMRKVRTFFFFGMEDILTGPHMFEGLFED